MNSMTPALIDYWHKLPARSAASRRRILEEARRRIDAGERGPPFPLHDDSELASLLAGALWAWFGPPAAFLAGAILAALAALGVGAITPR